MQAILATDLERSSRAAPAGIELAETLRTGAVHLRPRGDLFLDRKLSSLQSRALTYLRAGATVHLRGPAGTGKTTLALNIAALLGRPVVLLVGDSWSTSAHLLGEQTGVKTKQVVDRYVSSIRRVETETEAVWTDNALTTAIANGYTLVYDEFTRSSPQANNPLLMALEERMVVVSGRGRADRYEAAHPDFRAILTSNPEDYAGITQPQDALVDRMITFDFEYHSQEAEIGIVRARTGAGQAVAEVAVNIVRRVRESEHIVQSPSIRSALLIARVTHNEGFETSPSDPRFVQLCFDVLEAKSPGLTTEPGRRAAFQEDLSAAISEACAAAPTGDD